MAKSYESDALDMAGYYICDLIYHHDATRFGARKEKKEKETRGSSRKGKVVVDSNCVDYPFHEAGLGLMDISSCSTFAA